MPELGWFGLAVTTIAAAVVALGVLALIELCQETWQQRGSSDPRRRWSVKRPRRWADRS